MMSGGQVPPVMNSGGQVPPVMNSGGQVPLLMNSSSQVPPVMNSGGQVPLLMNSSSQVPPVMNSGGQVLPAMKNAGQTQPLPTTTPQLLRDSNGATYLVCDATTLQALLGPSQGIATIAAPSPANGNAVFPHVQSAAVEKRESTASFLAAKSSNIAGVPQTKKQRMSTVLQNENIVKSTTLQKKENIKSLLAANSFSVTGGPQAKKQRMSTGVQKKENIIKFFATNSSNVADVPQTKKQNEEKESTVISSNVQSTAVQKRENIPAYSFIVADGPQTKNLQKVDKQSTIISSSLTNSNLNLMKKNKIDSQIPQSTHNPDHSQSTNIDSVFSKKLSSGAESKDMNSSLSSRQVPSVNPDIKAATAINTSKSSVGYSGGKKKWDIEKVPDSCRANFIFFDLETTSLKADCNITQIAAIDDDLNDFSEYIIPRKKIDPMSSHITGITYSNKVMRVWDKPVNAKGQRVVLSKFLDWLKKKSPALLIAHNAKFDYTRFFYAIYQEDMVEAFEEHIVGFVDTLPLFQIKYPRSINHKLATLVHQILKKKFDSHNAVADVEMMRNLFHHMSDQCSFSPSPYAYSCTFRSAYDKWILTAKVKKGKNNAKEPKRRKI